MKTLRMFFAWPLIFVTVWYLSSFQTGAIVALTYLHIVTVLIFRVTERQKEKLIEIVEYIKTKDGLIDPKTMDDLSTIETAEDAIMALGKLQRP